MVTIFIFMKVPEKQKLQVWPQSFTVFSKYSICLAHAINAHCTSLAVLCIHSRHIITIEQKNLTNKYFLHLLEGTGIAQKILDLNSLKNIRKKTSCFALFFCPINVFRSVQVSSFTPSHGLINYTDTKSFASFS
jgi:hypothetical protein